MAKVKVTGDVKVSESGKQITLWETYDFSYKSAQGFITKEGRRKWTIWFEGSHPLKPGDWVELEGDFSSKIGSWEKDGETKAVVDHVINDPRIIAHKEVAQEKPVDLDDAAKYGMPF